MSEYYAVTDYGFKWGSVEVSRGFSDSKKGWVTLILRTPKADLQVYCTRTGKIRVHDAKGEWKRGGK